jgi:hypothetical protein
VVRTSCARAAVTGQEIRDGATDLDDAFGELFAAEDILEFGDQVAL